uniref:Uncharacterized protein n=1 Tax=Anguilla anguilla TaxID=7936 RepID=A0A0E9QU59_ANGAN
MYPFLLPSRWIYSVFLYEDVFLCHVLFLSVFSHSVNVWIKPLSYERTDDFFVCSDSLGSVEQTMCTLFNIIKYQLM